MAVAERPSWAWLSVSFGRIEELVQVDDVMGNRPDQPFVMACQEKAHIMLLDESPKKFCHLALHQWIEPRCRFIGYQTIGLEQEHTSDCDALQFSTGNLVRPPFEKRGMNRQPIEKGWQVACQASGRQHRSEVLKLAS